MTSPRRTRSPFATSVRPPTLGAGALLAVALWAPAQAAQAAPPEWLARAVVDAADPQRIVLAYENRYGGLLFSSDGGRHFDMRCMFSISTGAISTRWDGGSNDPVYEVTADGTVLVPTYDGLAAGDLSGCGFTQKLGNEGFAADALALHPTDRNVAFVHMSPNSYENASLSCTMRHGLWRRDADGTFTAIGPDTTEPGSQANACLANPNVRALAAVASGDRVRLYEFGSRRDNASTTVRGLVRYAEIDAAGTLSEFTEHAFSDELNAIGITPSVLLTNPDDPKELLIRFDVQDGVDRVFLTRDAGATFTEVQPGQLTNVSNAVRDAEGRLWLADRGDTANADRSKGLWMAAGFDAPFTHVGSTVPLYCLAASPSGLLGCTLYGFGPVDPATGEVQKTFDINETRAYVSCPGETVEGKDVAALCKDQMCNPAGGESWCGPRHHAGAPICDQYNTTDPCCGWPARDYDYMAEQGIPNPTGACRAVPPYYTDGGVQAEDGGGLAGDAGSSDAGTGPRADAGAVDGGSGGGGAPVDNSDDGCSCNLAHTARPGHGARAWGALGLALALVLRRRRRTGS